MFYKIVIFLTFTVFCVNSECDQGCKTFRQNIRVKRGKFYSSPPIKFYSRPPSSFPVKGPFSYTPPPFMTDDEPSYTRSRPHKVSKRPTLPSNDGLGDDDITNLVKYLSKQDLDKILEFAQEKGQSKKYKDVHNTNEYSRPYKRESKIVYKGNVHTKFEDLAPFKEESTFPNYVTEPTYVKVFSAQENNNRPSRINTQDRPKQRFPLDTESYSPSQRIPDDVGSFPFSQDYMNSQVPVSFPVNNNHGNHPTYVEVFAAQEPQSRGPMDSGKFTTNQGIPHNMESLSTSQTYENSYEPISSPVPNNPYYTETNEEEKLPQPVNMRQEDYEVSYTNNVPKIVKADSSSYEVEDFGDLPLMDYNSKLHDVSSYHVPHYTVTQPKPSKPAALSPPVSFPSFSSSYSASGSSSTLLKPSPAAAAIKEPIYERAPSTSAAVEQSDAHLKAIKIWSHKSQGAAYTLHDDGTLTPERHRPKYG